MISPHLSSQWYHHHCPHWFRHHYSHYNFNHCRYCQHHISTSLASPSSPISSLSSIKLYSLSPSYHLYHHHHHHYISSFLPTTSKSSTRVPKIPGGRATRMTPAIRSPAPKTLTNWQRSRSRQTENIITKTGEEKRMAVESPGKESVSLDFQI